MSNEQIPSMLHEDIDRLIHEPGRLNILLYLYVVEEADFTFLQKNTGLSKGNLSVHLQKLEQGGYIKIEKKFINKIPRTVISMSVKGRVAFEVYRASITKILGLNE